MIPDSAKFKGIKTVKDHDDTAFYVCFGVIENFTHQVKLQAVIILPINNVISMQFSHFCQSNFADSGIVKFPVSFFFSLGIIISPDNKNAPHSWEARYIFGYKNSGRCFTFNETSSSIFACQQLYLPTLMVVCQFTIPMPVYQNEHFSWFFLFPVVSGIFHFQGLKVRILRA